MMRAVLALLCLLEGATCRVTERDGRVPPSKKIKKVDCGGWNHPDSEENTRKTVYGKIGWACMAEYGEKGEIGEDQTLIDVGIGTGFDDDRPVRDDVYETRYADPYVCWNKHLYKAYVGWNLVAAYLFSAGFFLVKAKITWPRVPPGSGQAPWLILAGGRRETSHSVRRLLGRPKGSFRHTITHLQLH